MRHRFHALCPYFAMFPETFAEKWIRELTRKNEIILDPFCGRGTTGLTALLLHRRAVSSDINDVAICVTRAKTQSPTLSSVRRRIAQLQGAYSADGWLERSRELPEFFHVAYSPSTLAQLIFVRSTLNWKRSRTDAMVGALVLGALHGETLVSEAYLSNQMPRTISTKPAYSLRYWNQRGLRPPERDVFKLLLNRAAFRYESDPPVGKGLTLQSDVRDLPWSRKQLPGPIRCVITSPPYLDVTNFEEDQWLRIWFLGGPTQPRLGQPSGDDRHRRSDRYWSFLGDTWRSLGLLVAPKGHVVFRIGSTREEPEELISKLATAARVTGRGAHLVSCEVSELRKRQTDNFRPGSKGCSFEVDCHFQLTN
jgi:DNA methylase